MTTFTRIGGFVSAVILFGALSLGASPGRAHAGSDRPDEGARAVLHKAGGRAAGKATPAKGVLYRTGAEAIEPTIGVNDRGHLFFAAGSQLDVLRSRDDGRTWEIVSPLLPTGQRAHVITLDPYIYLAESTGRLFDIDLTVACSYLSFTDDGGKSWTTNPLACGRPVNDHQTLFGGPPAMSPMAGYPEVLYYCWNDIVTTSCSKSIDGGITWIAGSPAFLGFQPGEGTFPEQCVGFTGHGVVGPDGTVYLPKEYCGQPFIGISHDEGATWDQVQVANNTTEYLGSDTSVAVDAKGNLYYVYETAKQELYLAVSTDGGETWRKPLMVGHPDVEEVTLPTVDAGRPGHIAIGYMATTDSPFTRCDPDCTSDDYKDTTWNGYITVTAGALDRDPLFVSTSANHPSDPLYRGRCDFNTRCGPILDFMDVEISPNGTPYAAFVDACILTCIGGGPPNAREGVVGRLLRGPELR